LKGIVTIINPGTGDQIAKVFRDPDYQQLKFSPGSEFWTSQHPAHDLQSLASVIGELGAELTKAFLRG
jgi:hypothetical protein